MKTISRVLLAGCLAAGSFGCTAGERQSETNSPQARDADSGAVAAASGTPGRSGQPGPANAVPANAANTEENAIAAAGDRRPEAMRPSGATPAPENFDVEAMLKRSTRPAPENSTFAVAMGEVVVERRTFLKHPVLARVEKVTGGSRPSVKVEMTDGRTIDLRPEAIQNLSVISSAAILQAAGLPPQDTRRTDRKPGAANRN